MDTEALIAAGLYDPGAPDADNRLPLLGYLMEHGATVDEMVEAVAESRLASLESDRRLRAGDSSAEALAQRTGTPLVEVLDAYRLLGIPLSDPREPALFAKEDRLFEILALARATLPEVMVDEILLSIGAALARVAESAVSAFVGSVEDLLEEGSPRDRAEATAAATDLGIELGDLLSPLLHHHLWGATQRQREAMRTSADRRESQVTLGFVDLVGFTATTAQMSSGELLEFMQGFHRRAFDIVTGAGGRVVKHIGDEIMFAGADATTGCRVALDLVDGFRDAGSLPRGGVAHGIVVARHGDYYGPVVNLAARLADVAVPGEVLGDAGLADAAAPDSYRFEPAGLRQLKGFSDPVRVVSVGRLG